MLVEKNLIETNLVEKTLIEKKYGSKTKQIDAKTFLNYPKIWPLFIFTLELIVDTLFWL